MRRPALLKQPPGSRRRTSQTASIPAPVGGWNARDPVADMDPRDALILKNWFPSTGNVRLRKGWDEHVTGIGDQVETLMPYNEADGTETLFGAAGDSFYNVTSSGAVGAAVQSSLSNARWQFVNFINSSGTSYLCNFNGVDKPRYWDGSSWTTVDSGSTPAITGVTSSNLNNPWIHKRRMWMVEVDSLSAWYLPVDAVGGAASEFDLSGIFQLGGYLVAGGTWTIDGGSGLDDFWIAVTSSGEVAVYQGTDPSSGDTWKLVGVWRIGEPVGNRCLLKYIGDLLIICKDGVYPLSKALQSSQFNPRVAITDKIRGAVVDAMEGSSGNFGWQLTFYPPVNMLILNVPVSEGSDQEQYVMNTITGAWGQFTNIEANCWAESGGNLYFGGDGFVGQFWDDFVSDNDDNIDSDLLQAFSYFGDRGGLKHWKMLRPIFSTNGVPEILVSLNVDYEDIEPSAPLTFSAPAYGLWDSGTWDSALWGADAVILKNWQTVSGYGTCAALRMLLASNNVTVKFQAADYVYETGGVI